MLLVAVLLVAMSVPSFMLAGAKADETVAKSINIGTSNITVPDGGWTKVAGHYINFGKGNGDELGDYNGKALKYRVLSNDGNTMLIDSDETLFNNKFDETDNDYAGSALRNAIYEGTEFFPNDTEKSIVKSTTLGANGKYNTYWTDDSSSDNCSFVLSAREAYDLYATDTDRIKSGTYGYWWLRSASSYASYSAGYVVPSGALSPYVYVTYALGVAPASNLDLTNVLFSSDAGFSKTVALAKVNTTETKTWNLTIKDESKTVTAQKATIDAEKKVSVPVKLTGDNITQVSVVITNGDISSSDTEILYYGKLDGINASSTDQQTGTFTLPSDFNDDTDKAYVLAEDLTSATSDLASTPVEISWDNAYSVEFDTNDATSGDVENQTVKEGETISEAAKAAAEAVTKTNYTLGGWFENSDFSGDAFDFATAIVKNTKLYAKWLADEYEITYNLDGGALAEGVTNPDKATVETEDFVLNNPTKEGCKFLGWTGNGTNEPTTEMTVTEGSITAPTTFTANWEVAKTDKKDDPSKGNSGQEITNKGDGSNSDSKSAKTGDEANIGLLAVLALSSLGTGAGLAVVTRKKK